MSSRTYPCVLWHATRSPRANFNFHMRTCRTEPCYAQPQIFLPEPVWALTTESPTVQRASHVAVLPAGALLHHRFEVLGDVEGAASRLLDLLQRHIHKAHAARAEDLPDDPQEVLVMRILAPASSTPAIEYVEDVSLA